MSTVGRVAARRRLAVGAAALGAALGLVAALSGAGTAAADPGTPGCNPDPAGDFTHTVPTVPGPPQVSAVDGNGLVFAAMVGADKKAYDYGLDGTTDPLGVTELFCEGGGLVDAPYLAGSADGSISQLFGLAPTKVVYYRTMANGTVTPWLKVPGSLAGSGPIAMVTPTRTDLFYVSATTTQMIYHHTFQNGVWSGPEKFAGAGIGRISGYRLPNGNLRLWLTGPNHAIYTTTGSTGHWGGWKKLPSGATLRGVSATIGADPASGREDVFAVGTTGGLWQASFTNNLATFSGWTKVEPTLPSDSDISAAAAAPGTIIVYTKLGANSGVIAYDQFVNAQWSGLFLAPYACETCAPAPPPTTSSSRPKLAPAPRVHAG